MKDTVLIIGLLLILTGAAALLILAEPSMGTIHITTFTTDRSVYHSNEKMLMTVGFSATKAVENVTLQIEGIRDRTGSNRLNISQPLHLAQGENTLTLNYTLPVCSRCAGLPKGNYSIEARVIKDLSTVTNATINVTLA